MYSDIQIPFIRLHWIIVIIVINFIGDENNFTSSNCTLKIAEGMKWWRVTLNLGHRVILVHSKQKGRE